MSHQKGSIEGMQTAEGLHLVIAGNAFYPPEKPARRRRRWPLFVLVLVAFVAAVVSYLPRIR